MGGEKMTIAKEYKLVYKEKAKTEEILRNTPFAPLQEIRHFNEENRFNDGWRNLLIFGDNLLALQSIYQDQQEENRYQTKEKIKCIYIDPPFASNKDYMKDKERAYRDKVNGSAFIEFLRKRLIFLYQILANDGHIFVHLDWKKGHYIKVLLDEIFGEHNFVNEIYFKTAHGHNLSTKGFDNLIGNIFVYQKSEKKELTPIYQSLDEMDLYKKFPYIEKETGRRYNHEKLEKSSNKSSKGEVRIIQGKEIVTDVGWVWTQKTFDERLSKNPHLIYWTENDKPRYKNYLDEYKGRKIGNLWNDLTLISSNSQEGNYPTQKPESLLERIIKCSTEEGDIVLDAFAGGGTTPAVAEKMGRRWVAIDASKLSIYTIQKRLLELNCHIGPITKDERKEVERIVDYDKHPKTTRGMFMTHDKSRINDLVITDEFLIDFSRLLSTYLQGNTEEKISLVCHPEKFCIKELAIYNNSDQNVAGDKIVKIGRVHFHISFIIPKKETPGSQPIPAKTFTLCHSGIYDLEKIKQMIWSEYKPFVMKLFQVRPSPHKIYQFQADGYIGRHSAFVWNYPDSLELVIDEGYVHSIHQAVRGRAGSTMYIVVPSCAMGFMTDEIHIDDTDYVFLKVPESILRTIIERQKMGAMKQPHKEDDTYQTIISEGLDFISQPQLIVQGHTDKNDWIFNIYEFRSSTFLSDPEDFVNFETLSMVLIDAEFDGKYFKMTHVFWGRSLIETEAKRINLPTRTPWEEKLKNCQRLEFRLPKSSCGERIMVIFVDCYGNEKKKEFSRGEIGL